jgi:hypothetical protein
MDNNALIAALAGAAVATIGVVVAKDTKVSEFRQEWIDAVRDDVAKLSSLAAASLRERKTIPVNIAVVKQIADEFTHLLHRVRLRLDLKKMKKQDHKDLNEALVALMKVATNNAATFSQLELALNKVGESAALVLDTAWKRVKRGETRFLYVLVSAVASLIFFGALWIYQWRHPSTADINCITLEQPVHVDKAPQSLPTPSSLPALRAPLLQTPHTDK